MIFELRNITSLIQKAADAADHRRALVIKYDVDFSREADNEVKEAREAEHAAKVELAEAMIDNKDGLIRLLNATADAREAE